MHFLSWYTLMPKIKQIKGDRVSQVCQSYKKWRLSFPGNLSENVLIILGSDVESNRHWWSEFSSSKKSFLHQLYANSWSLIEYSFILLMLTGVIYFGFSYTRWFCLALLSVFLFWPDHSWPGCISVIYKVADSLQSNGHEQKYVFLLSYDLI